jgi:hypothetical protein
VSLLETFQQTDIFPTCFDDDPHWNRNGMELASAAIAEWLRVHAISQASVLQQLRQ